MPLFEFKPVAEFEDRLGVVRSISPCSLLGREEFKERLLQIQDRLSASTGAWQDTYDRDRYLQFLIQRCLTLNGIDPDWVNLPLVEKLLFNDGDRPGWLVQVNLNGTIDQSEPQEATGKKSGEPMTAIELIGLLAHSEGSVGKAIELAQSVPADLLVEAIDQKALWADPKARERKKIKQKFSKKKITGEELDRLLSAIPIEGGEEVELPKG